MTSEAYMIAVKEKITQVEQEISAWKAENQDKISASEELLPGTYFKLRYPDDLEAQKAASEVQVNHSHLLDALA